MAPCGCAPADRVAASAQAIVGGTATTEDPSVVVVVAQLADAKYATLCTGTVVSPHVVLTAAHCIDPDVVGQGAKYSVLLGPTIDRPAAEDLLVVSEIHYNEKFDKNDVTKGGDIGVVVMRDALPVPVRAMNRSGLEKSMIGQPARLVGYGQTTGDDSTGATAGVRRAVLTTMGTYTDELVRFGSAGQGTCVGDSGGPAFMTVDGAEVIVGVVSFGDKACAELGVDTRVDVYAADSVDPFIAAADPDMPLPPPPSSGCGFAGQAPSGSALLGAVLVLAVALAGRRDRLRG